MIFVYTTIYEPVSSQISIFLTQIVEMAFLRALGPILIPTEKARFRMGEAPGG
jgi:hypothetical protein